MKEGRQEGILRKEGIYRKEGRKEGRKDVHDVADVGTTASHLVK
jgi:hypothetical protein